MPDANVGVGVEEEVKESTSDSTEVDTKVKTGLADRYNAYRKSDLKVSPKFAEVCNFVKLHKVNRRNLINILVDNVKMGEPTAKVEATHILNICKDANAEILDLLNKGEITVATARTESSSKKIAEREAAKTAAQAEEKAREEAAAKGEEYVPPAKPEKGAAAQKQTGPGRPMAPVKERILNELAAIVGKIIDANDTELTEEWFLSAVKNSFEEIRAERQAQEVKRAEAAKKSAETTETPVEPLAAA